MSEWERKIWMIEQSALLELEAISKKEKRMEINGEKERSVTMKNVKCHVIFACAYTENIMVPVINIRWNGNFYSVFDTSCKCFWIAQKFSSFPFSSTSWRRTFELNGFHEAISVSICCCRYFIKSFVDFATMKRVY